MGTKYRVLIGANYPDGAGGEVRIEAGDELEIPEKNAKALLHIGAIEKADAPKAVTD